MTEKDAPPTEAEQDPPHPYTEEALARLMLSDAYRDVAEYALTGITTWYDSARAPEGSYVEEAARLLRRAEEVLRWAAIYERERGTSWEDIGEALGITKQSAHKKFTEHVETWRAPFDKPEKINPDGTPDDDRLPFGARYTEDAGIKGGTAEYTAQELERWLRARTASTDSWSDEEHPVTGRLPRYPTTSMVILVSRVSQRLLEEQLVPDPHREADVAERRAALYERLIREGGAPPEAHEWIEKDRARAAALRATPGHGVKWEDMGKPPADEQKASE